MEIVAEEKSRGIAVPSLLIQFNPVSPLYRGGDILILSTASSIILGKLPFDPLKMFLLDNIARSPPSPPKLIFSLGERTRNIALLYLHNFPLAPTSSQRSDRKLLYLARTFFDSKSLLGSFDDLTRKRAHFFEKRATFM